MQQKTNTMHISTYIKACIQLCMNFPLDINTYFHSRRLEINSPQWVAATEEHDNILKSAEILILPLFHVNKQKVK